MKKERHGGKRTEPQRKLDRERIAELFLLGHSMREIAKQLTSEREYSISHVTIKADIDSLLTEWQESRLSCMDKIVAGELEKLLGLEKTAWQAWQMSVDCGEPDPRYLSQIEKCYSRRATLLGLDAPRKQAITADVHVEKKTDLSNVSDDDLATMADILRKSED